jgi:hypothetical protein
MDIKKNTSSAKKSKSPAKPSKRMGGVKRSGPSSNKKEKEYTAEVINLAKKALKVLRATDPQTLDDIPVKSYSPEDMQEIMRVHCSAMAEHADTVQILLTVQEGGKTLSYSYGLGNHYARVAQAQDWLGMMLGGPTMGSEGLSEFGDDPQL